MIPQKIFVTGGGTFLGDQIAAALLAEGAEVTLLVRPGAEARIGGLASRVRWFVGDVWEPSSLRGRARGHQAVIHTVGSLTADPARGLTYSTLNLISARNVANMCVNAGVGHMVLMSSARAPWINADYLRAKREAEVYLDRVGLRRTIIRAPLLYVRGAQRNPLFSLLSLLGAIPPLSLALSAVRPMPIDVLARGVARITLDPTATQVLFSARDLRRRNTRQELRSGESDRILPNDATPADIALLDSDEDVPFGWTPPG